MSPKRMWHTKLYTQAQASICHRSVLFLYTLFICFHAMQLIAGSSNADSSNDGKSAEVTAGGGAQAEKDDGYQAGIPGPITRLFIIANRGIANLMQDLILVSGAENSIFYSIKYQGYSWQTVCCTFSFYESRTESHEQQFFCKVTYFIFDKPNKTTLIYITFFIFPHNRHFFVHNSPSVLEVWKFPCDRTPFQPSEDTDALLSELPPFSHL